MILSSELPGGREAKVAICLGPQDCGARKSTIKTKNNINITDVVVLYVGGHRFCPKFCPGPPKLSGRPWKLNINPPIGKPILNLMVVFYNTVHTQSFKKLHELKLH